MPYGWLPIKRPAQWRPILLQVRCPHSRASPGDFLVVGIIQETLLRPEFLLERVIKEYEGNETVDM